MRIQSNIGISADLGSYDQKQNQTESNIQQEAEVISTQAKVQNFPGEQQLLSEIERASHDVKIQNTNLKFSIHEKTKEIMVKVINSETHEVVREIPSEKILDMVAAMLERTGLFVDKKI